MEGGEEGERWERGREEKGRDGQGTTGMGREGGREVKGWQGKAKGCEWEGESTSPSRSHSYLLMPISTSLHSLSLLHSPSPSLPRLVRSLVRVFVRPSLRPFVHSLARSFARTLMSCVRVSVSVGVFVCLSVCLFVCVIACALACLPACMRNKGGVEGEGSNRWREKGRK